MESNLENSVRCEFCGRSFGRQEHLDRHVRSHSNRRPFRCDGCGQYFSRRDTRNRHAATSCPKAGRPRTRAYSNRARAACVPCSRSKLRCSTGSPCSRCHNKGLTCSYRESKDTVGRSRVFKTLQASGMRSDCSITDDGVASQPATSPESSQRANLEAQLVSTSINCNDSYLIHPEPNENPEDSRSEEPIWPIMDLSDLAYLDLLMPFEENSFFSSEQIAQLNQDASDESIPKSIPLQRVSTDIEDVHSGIISKPPSAHETHLRFRCGGIVQPFLWRAKSSASPYHDDTSSIAKISHETELDLHFIGISDKDLLEMDDYAHVPKLKSGNPILQELFDFFAQEKHRVLGTVELEIPVLCDEKAINSFVQLYFENFHPGFPMLHTSTFDMFNTNWILALAVVAIGSRYSRVRQARQYATIFGKYLRHAIASLGEDKIEYTLRVPFVQATILSQIDMSYSGAKTLYLQSQFQKNMLATLCRGLGTGLSRGYVTHTLQNCHRETEPYYQWLGRELAVRAVYCGWLYDCQLNLNCDIPAIMSLDGFDISLPCHEDIWNKTESDWMKVFQNDQTIASSPKVHEILTLITQKRDNIPSIGDFSRTLAMMAIYQQSRVIMDASFIMTNTAQTVYSQRILGHSIYPEWRDSTVETLQLLSQSSKDPMLSDLYHHLMVIFHIPLKSLCTVAGWTATEDAILSTKKELYKWMVDNPRAARKALLHGAILFKSLRSRPLNTYSEAHELLVATLTIWTYISLHPPRSEDTLTGPIIYLDRHMTDDQERCWILSPNSDSPLYISGVGCILNNSAAVRVLLEAKGCFTRKSHPWGIYNQVMTVFEVMASSGTAISLDQF